MIEDSAGIIVSKQREDDKDAGPDKITFVPYRDDEELRRPAPERHRIELFRRSYDPHATDKPPEREKRIKFEVVDDSPTSLNKRSGFNPYDTTAKPNKGGPRR